MINGTDPITPTTEVGNNGEVIQGFGLTKKEHMVIEFTKAFLSTGGECTNNTLEQNAEWAIRQANEVIKQLNEEK